MTGRDDETVAFYDAKAKDYADFDHTDVPPEVARFIALTRPGGEVLDWGCGHGHISKTLQDAGLTVDARDASASFAALAAERFGVTVRVEVFADLDETNRYDSACACFSLLHIPRAEMPDALSRMYAALKPGGVAYLGLKAGEGDKRDRLGRFYTYYTAAEISGLLTDAGFEVTDCEESMLMGLTGDREPCLHIYARRPVHA